MANELLRHDAAAYAIFVPAADAIKHADQAFVFADEERVLTLLISLIEVRVERCRRGKIGFLIALGLRLPLDAQISESGRAERGTDKSLQHI